MIPTDKTTHTEFSNAILIHIKFMEVQMLTGKYGSYIIIKTQNFSCRQIWWEKQSKFFLWTLPQISKSKATDEKKVTVYYSPRKEKGDRDASMFTAYFSFKACRSICLAKLNT